MAEKVRQSKLRQAEDIYERDYWAKAGCPDMPPRLAFHVFDAAVNNGVGNAARWLQGATSRGLPLEGGEDRLEPAQLTAVRRERHQDRGGNAGVAPLVDPFADAGRGAV